MVIICVKQRRKYLDMMDGAVVGTVKEEGREKRGE